jgi:S-DNA-T family DNA segregation ATPase FtsK/SpoIIIE
MAQKKPVKNGRRTTSCKPDKKTDKKSSDNAFGRKALNFFSDERTHFIVGFLLLLVMLYLLLAFVSYFFKGAADQSKIDLSWNELHDKRTLIQNWTSVTGAIAAEHLINRWFGISAFFIPIFGIWVALRLMKAHEKSIWKAFFHCAFWLVWRSVALGLTLSPYFSDVLFFSLAGGHGDYAAQWLVSYIGASGSFLLMGGSFIVYLVVASASSLPFLRNLFKKKKYRCRLPEKLTWNQPWQ